MERGDEKLPFAGYSVVGPHRADTRVVGGRRVSADSPQVPAGVCSAATLLILASGAGGADRFPGGHRSRVTPVPIPNTEVKPATADGTAWVTVWESRSLPGLFSQGPHH